MGEEIKVWYDKEGDYLEGLASQIQRRADFDPMDVLDIRERQLKNAWESNALSMELYEQYLEMVYLAGRVCSESNRFWLTRS